MALRVHSLHAQRITHRETNMDLEYETVQLGKALEHLAEANRRIDDQEGHLLRLDEKGLSTDDARRLLTILLDARETMKAHIAQTREFIELIKKGVL